MKNLEEIIAGFNRLNQNFYSNYCLNADCNKCPFTGNCLASEFDDHLVDLKKLKLSLKKLNGDGE